ncbi:MAG: enamine deaminase RidA (YjgF/YER057c/UK114 family) [Hyphomicrobiaceae bacterium]|jgi:enamine deaminase RidA (YjgF/YER057c/UK114 family)
MAIERHEQNKVFSKVVEANGFVFTSGITANDNSLDVLGQTKQTLDEIDRLLALCGTDKSKVISSMIWVTDIRHRDAMNEAWFEWTGGQNMPVRACVEAALADPKLLVEIQVTAAK